MKKYITICAVTITFVALILKPEVAAEAVLSSLKITVSRVIPSIFPFMVLSDFVLSCTSSKITKNKAKRNTIIKKLWVILIGNVSGFPVGAKSTAELYLSGEIDKRGAAMLSVLSGNAGISFVLSYVGTNLFSSSRIGLILYLSQLFGSVITATAYSVINRGKVTSKDGVPLNKNSFLRKSTEESFISAVSGSALSALSVTAFITVFGVIIKYVKYFVEKIHLTPTNSQLLTAATSSILEISNGCMDASTLRSPYCFALCAFAIGFSGMSVIFQSMVYLKKANISAALFISLKFVQGSISMFVTYGLLKVFPVVTQVSTWNLDSTSFTKITSLAVLAVILLYFLICFKKIFLKSIIRKENS